ncbi:efflux RND transporter periplasmic adaptor subunit [Rhodobium gokarnense]|uniref:efflux RND transporter periplasmic adaptor subunit n=1 Tax=Rhodobium gokarnense TaxID=364296 RepID=UPI003873AF76
MAQRHSVRTLLRTGLVALFTAAALVAASESHAQSPGGGPKPEVGVLTLHPQSVAITAELPGRTTASLVAEVRPQVNGIIRRRLFTEGSEVEAGAPLYQIDDATYRATYQSARASLQKALAAVPSAEAKVARYENLIKQNAISKQELDDAKATLAQARADVAVAKAQVETARINLTYTTVLAPIDGRVDESQLTVGALVTANQSTALTTIRTLDPINVDVTQSSTNLLNLRKAVEEGRIKLRGDNITVRLKLETGTLYAESGTLAFVESYVDQTTGTYTLRAEFPNPDRLLLPGMYVRALVEEGIAENSFVVPQRAVSRSTKGEATALFVNKDNKIEQRVLETNSSVGNNWLVSDGISDGDRIVVTGSQFVREGADVTTVEVVIDETTGEVSELKQGAAAPGDPDTLALAAEAGQKQKPGAAKD